MTFHEPAAATVLQTSFQTRKAIYDSNVLHACRDQCGIFPCCGEFGGPRSLTDEFGRRDANYKRLSGTSESQICLAYLAVWFNRKCGPDVPVSDQSC